MREQRRTLKCKLCKLIEQVWITLSLASLASLGFLLLWFCGGVLIFGGLSIS